MANTPKGRRTEAAFLEAARTVFAEKGYFNTKISDIAAAAGRSAGSFYNYYDNKEELLEALLAQFSSEVQGTTARLHHKGDPYENIVEAVRAYWSSYRKYLPEMIGVFQMSMTDPEYARRWRRNRAAGVRSIVDGIVRARSEGYDPDLDTEVLASALVSTLESFCWVWMVGGGDEGVPAPDDETAIRTLAAIWYRTVFFNAPDPAQAVQDPAPDGGSGERQPARRAAAPARLS
ncbi:TetR/AcrR family transcriptional regulator [Actinomadura soli]|uniref:TetR/AcrR family transcriptional regulator n=1 Tax=Actinomadura soli TaxID=2508997 RepID=A0A5C4JH05_9ACTN|nr:TetR/AcrR family transcriptional regulator [Actinomadura soli]TMR05017.1 TetR/AcrR family transcriptional regulator [Actinomadura soli]